MATACDATKATATTRKIDDKKPNGQSTKIYVVVVESHQHVLEHIHTVLRKERLLTQPWSMLHFDSHPDLACPNTTIPAKACFLPRETFPVTNNTVNKARSNGNPEAPIQEEKNLYELLDSTATGIAEWILPLVLAANLQHVHWIKPTASTDGSANTNGNLSLCPPSQLPEGIHQYRVGAAMPCPDQTDSHGTKCNVESFVDLPTSATVKVDWPHPYYLEDDCTVHYGKNHEELFLFSQPFQLQVSSLSTDKITALQHLQRQHDVDESKTKTIFNNSSDNSLWEIDICLDYFACRNPFLTDLEAQDLIFTQALLKAVYQSRFYTPQVMNVPTNANPTHNYDKVLTSTLQRYRHDLQEFWKFLVDLLRQQLPIKDTEDETSSNYLHPIIEKYYIDATQGQLCISSLVKAFRAHRCRTTDSMAKSTNLIAMTEQALPNLTMPHDQLTPLDVDSRSVIPDNNQGHTTGAHATTATVSQPISMASIRPILRRLQQEIEDRYHASSSMSRPFMITIARSTNDGFTPSKIVNELQEELIQNLHSLYCGCPAMVTSSAVHENKAKLEQKTCKFRLIFDYGPWEGSTF